MGQAPCAKGGQVGRRDRTAAPLTEVPPPGEAGDAGQARRPGQLRRSQGRGEGPLAPTPGTRKGF